MLSLWILVHCGKGKWSVYWKVGAVQQDLSRLGKQAEKNYLMVSKCKILYLR